MLKYFGLYYVAGTLILFAIAKFCGAQFKVTNSEEYTPLKELNNWQLSWAFYGRSYNYDLFIGVMEFIAGTFMLFGRSRLVGLLLAFGIYINIVVMDYEYEVPALEHATIEFIIVLMWLLPYLSDLKKYFWDMKGKFSSKEPNKNSFFSVYFPILFVLLSSFFALYLRRANFFPPDKIIGAYEILELSTNGKVIELESGKYTKKPMLFFEARNAFILSANSRYYYGNYEKKADSIFVFFDKKNNGIKSFRGVVHNDERIIKGLTNRGQFLEINMKEVRNEKD